MEEVHWCQCCEKRQRECTCTHEKLAINQKMNELEQARATVARLERDLGMSIGYGGNRAERRASASRSRRRS